MRTCPKCGEELKPSQDFCDEHSGELLFCPFCGSGKIETDTVKTIGVVWCQQCGGQMHASTPFIGGTVEQEAILRWNKRVTIQ